MRRLSVALLLGWIGVRGMAQGLRRVKEAAEVTRQEISNPPGALPPTHTEETVVRKYGTVEQPLTVTGDVVGLNLGVMVGAKGTQ